MYILFKFQAPRSNDCFVIFLNFCMRTNQKRVQANISQNRPSFSQTSRLTAHKRLLTPECLNERTAPHYGWIANQTHGQANPGNYFCIDNMWLSETQNNVEAQIRSQISDHYFPPFPRLLNSESLHLRISMKQIRYKSTHTVQVLILHFTSIVLRNRLSPVTFAHWPIVAMATDTTWCVHKIILQTKPEI